MINHLIAGSPLIHKFRNYKITKITKTPRWFCYLYPVRTGTPPQIVFTLSGSELYPTYSYSEVVSIQDFLQLGVYLSSSSQIFTSERMQNRLTTLYLTTHKGAYSLFVKHNTRLVHFSYLNTNVTHYLCILRTRNTC